MFENYGIKKQLKNLRKKPVSDEFLALLRVRLSEFTDANPVPEAQAVAPVFGASFFSYLFAKELRSISIPLATVLAAVLAGGGAAMASQASLPGDRLFPVKIMTEEVRTAFAFSPESRVSLQLKFTQERLKEIKEILIEKGVEPDGLEMAVSRLEDNSSRAASVIEGERNKGRRMDDLAVKIDDSLNSLEQNLRETFRAEKDKLKGQEDEFKSKINEARQKGNQTLVSQLRLELGGIHAKREFLESRGEDADDSLDIRQRQLRRGLDDEREINEQRSDAREAIKNAEREREEFFSEAAIQKNVVPEVRLKEIDNALLRARAAFDQDQFREAKIFARESRNISRDLENQLFDSSGPGPDSREVEDRGLEQEQRGQEQELRGREQEGEMEIRGQEQEVRGQEQEQRGQEPESGRDSDAVDDNSLNDDNRGRDRGGDDGSSGRNGGEVD